LTEASNCKLELEGFVQKIEECEKEVRNISESNLKLEEKVSILEQEKVALTDSNYQLEIDADEFKKTKDQTELYILEVKYLKLTIPNCFSWRKKPNSWQSRKRTWKRRTRILSTKLVNLKPFRTRNGTGSKTRCRIP
jgi:chromosome segregation ATPase